MLTQSKETQNAWRASQRTLDIKVTIDGKTYGATDVNSLKYDSGAYNGDTFAIGSTYSNTVQIEFSHLIEGLKLGMEVRPSIGIKTSSGYVYEPLGVFIISSEIKMDRNNNLTTVSASDRFCGLEGAYVSKLTYPAKVLDVIGEICAQSGVKANTDDLARLPHQADLPTPITGQSYRKALGWIAQLYVGYALFDRQGLFTIRTISEPNYELDPSQYEQAGLTKNEAAYKINGIQCQVTLTTKTRDGESTEETKTYQAGDATGSQIKLENNIMTPQRLNDIWEQLKDLTFYPFSLNWFGNPAVEAGDWLRLEDKQGNSFVVPNSSYTLDFNGGLSATSKADQTTSSDQMVPWQGSVAQTIKELQLRRSPDGTVVFPPNVTAPPTNAKFNDVWFKKNGNSTELWIFEKQDDGSGKWIRKDLSDDEIKKKVADAQQGLNQTKADIINNKQKADADIENLNKSIEDNKKATDQDIQNLNKSIEVNKKVAYESLQKLNDSVTNLQGQYDNNVVPNLNKVMADASDALQKYISAQNSIADLTKQAQQQGKDIADVTNTVKGLNINYANLAGDVNSTKVDVKGLQTTVGIANGDIAQLKLDAQNLQTMLAGKVDNTTYMNFVNLTNQALNARLTASDLNGYAKTVDLQATANGLKMNIDSVSGKLDNLRIGGKNLLLNSAGPFQPVFDGRIDNNQYYNNSTVNLVNGRQYTISGETNGVFSGDHQPEVESDKCILWLANTSQTIHQIVSDNNTANGTTFIWNRPTGTYTLRVNTYHPASTNKIKAWNIKIESGNKKTDWSPAPEDTERAFTEVNTTIKGLQSTVSNNHGELQSQISQTAKTIRQEVSDKTNGLQTQINQQANNFNVSLNSLRKDSAWQRVTSRVNANDMKTTGKYWIQATPNVNTPDDSAWAYMEVVAYTDVSRIKQTWQRDNDENQAYTRLFIGNHWTAWQKTVTSGNIMAQINMSAGTTLIQNNKIYMDAASTIFSGKAFIPSAAITSLTADKITAGTINGAKVNVINLNANNITAGTLRGSNGEFYLDSGALHVWQNNHDAWIDQNGIHDYDNQRSVWIQKGEINFEHQLGGSMKHTGVILTNSENSNLNGAITIKGDEGFLLSTKNFTTNYWSEQGFSWGTNTAHYVSGSGILGFNNNITVSAGSTDDHSIAALIAGAIPSKNLGNIFGARAQPGVYIYGRNDSNKDHSFVDIKAPASIHLTTLDSYITIGDTTGYERNSDVSINSGNYLTVSADNSINITACSKTKAGLMPRISLSEASTSISGDSITLNAKNYVTLLGSSVSVTGDFGVLGKKNAIVPTSRGMAAINAYETAEYYFGDIGETQTNSNGVVTVMIDPYFLETVNTLVPYQVFLTSYGDGNVWVSSRSANNFTVKSSNPNIHFAWEIKAKRKGYENDRMKIVKGVFNNEQY